MKIVSIISIGLVIFSSAIFADELGIPDNAVLEQNLREKGVISNAAPQIDPSDFIDPAPGYLRQHELKRIVELKDRLETLLSSNTNNNLSNNGATEVLKRLLILKESKLRNDFLKVIPLLLSSYSTVKALPQEEEITVEMKYLNILDELAQYVHGEIYQLIREKNAVLDAEEWVLVSQMSLYCSLWSMGHWVNRSDYILSAGAFIIDPEKACLELKSKGLVEVSSFLAGHKDMSFFERYEENGNGLPVLKEKYLANKAGIHAKFSEVLVHATTIEAVNEK